MTARQAIVKLAALLALWRHVYLYLTTVPVVGLLF